MLKSSLGYFWKNFIKIGKNESLMALAPKQLRTIEGWLNFWAILVAVFNRITFELKIFST